MFSTIYPSFLGIAADMLLLAAFVMLIFCILAGLQLLRIIFLGGGKR